MSNIRQVRDGFRDFGEVIYMVDSDYRTGAQGWSRADRTGPLDLIADRPNSQFAYTFRTADYARDQLAVQAAIDAAIDFRGDAILFTPGNYSLGTAALSVDVPDLRLLGPRCSSPLNARATLTDALGTHDITGAADRLEVGYLRFVPLTAQAFWQVATGANGQHWHHFLYDSLGIAASTGTQLLLVDGSWNLTAVEDFYFYTDAAQGPLIELDGTVLGLDITRFLHWHNAGTLANALLAVDGVGATGIRIGPGHGQIGGAGAVTSLFEHADMTSNATNITVTSFTGSVAYCTAATLTPAASAAAEADYVSSWIATIGGGAGRAAYTGTS